MADTVFSGTSRYTTDFQQIIDRSVAIASLPLTQLRQQTQVLQEDRTAWTSLQTRFSGLRTALTNISDAVNSGAVAGSSTDASVATLSVGSEALDGTYSVKVEGTGARTTALSAAGVSDPAVGGLSSATTYSLTANGQSYTVTAASTSLQSLVSAINGDASIGVQATIVNVSSPGQTAEYRLSLQSTKYSAQTISLSYDETDPQTQVVTTKPLLNAATPGSPVTYRVNNYPAPGDPPIESDTRTVTLSPGITASFLKSGTTDMFVGRNAGGISAALSNFVAAYNTAVTEVDAHRGENRGALKGDSGLSTMSASLRAMLKQSLSSGTVRDVSDLGLQFTDRGTLTFDSTKLNKLDGKGINDLLTFLGGTETGGFLQSADLALDSVDDADKGLFRAQLQQIDKQLTAQDKLIAANEERIADLEVSLVQRMAAADALIASLEQQVSYFTGMFEAMRASQSGN